MYIEEGIEFVMMFKVGVLLLSGNIGILDICESGIVDVCDSDSISCASTVELVVVTRGKGMFFSIVRLSMSFVFILIAVS
jgi:hypothetical protein